MRLAPKAHDVLALLLRQAGHLVTKDALLSQVWPDACVEEGILTVHISALRKAFGDDKRASGYIETVPQIGISIRRTGHAANRSTTETMPLHAQPRPLEVYELVGRGRARVLTGSYFEVVRRRHVVSGGDRARSDVRRGTRRSRGRALPSGLASAPCHTPRPLPMRRRRHCARWPWTATAPMRRWRWAPCYSPASGTGRPPNEACGGRSRSTRHIPRRSSPTAA